MLADQVAEAVEAVRNAGIPKEIIKKRGQLTVWERIEYLIDPGTWCPLHTLYNPQFNEEGTTGVIDGLAKINGKWAVVIGFDNKVMAGAWIAGQADNQLRVTDMAKRLHIPLVWVVNCSGVKLTEQQEVYANRRGNGTTFFRHAELEKLGVPVIAGIYGTNPAGGGYQGISPTILLAHKDANIAVGGGGIVGGMSPKGSFDEEGAEQLIEATRHFKQVPPGSVPIHYNETGFFKEVYETEEGVLDALKKYVDMAPAYDPKILLKIILFAYSRGVVSSRKIERACRENVIFMALSTDSRPHFTTIADFISSKVNIQWNLFCIIHNMKKGHAYGIGFV
jgi:glutaconyl-CoA decarboxylase